MTVYLATTAPGLARAEARAGSWDVETLLPGADVRCLAADPSRPGVVWAGTQGDGVLRSEDAGRTWQPGGLAGLTVKSLFCAVDRVYAGTKPPAVFASAGGGPWEALGGFRKVRRPFWFSPAERPFTAYVQGLAVAGDTVVAGIEAGAVVRSTDGGVTWQGHRRGSLRDCHSLAVGGGRFYEAGGTGGGAACSVDGGRSWQRPQGHDRHYGWACAVDPAEPELWYFSAAPGIRAHSDDADAAIYRCRGAGEAKLLTGGLPEPLRGMPYGLVAGPAAGELTAGLSSGEVWHSPDAGDSWKLLGRLPGVERSFIRVET